MIIALLNISPSYGQHKPDEKVTVSIKKIQMIELKNIAQKEIKVAGDNYTVYFDKHLTLESIQGQIDLIKKELPADLPKDDWRLEALHRVETVRDYIISSTSLDLKVYDQSNDTSQPIYEIHDPFKLTERLFWELACEMVDKGLFDLTINKRSIPKVTKALVSKTGRGGDTMTSIQYMVKDKFIWMCPPITVE